MIKLLCLKELLCEGHIYVYCQNKSRSLWIYLVADSIICIGDRDHVWCYDNPQGYSVDAQKITIYADITDRKEREEDFFF